MRGPVDTTTWTRPRLWLAGCPQRPGAYVKYDPTTLEYARYAGDVIRRHAEEWEGYQKRFPQMVDKKIFLSIDEYAYSLGGGGRTNRPDSQIRVGLRNAVRRDDAAHRVSSPWERTYHGHVLARHHSHRLRIQRPWTCLQNVWRAFSREPFRSPYRAIRRNRRENPLYADEPKTSSGSPTYPLDMIAARSRPITSI
jgi:alpha-N-arabinofuranosidase